MSDTCRKILAHRVIIDGVEYPLAVVTIQRTGQGWSATVAPFECECEGTEFHSGTVVINTDKLPEVLFRKEVIQ